MKNGLLAVALLASGCASMVNGRWQDVPVDSFPSGANVTVDCGEAKRNGGTTPTVVKLQRGADHCTLYVSKEQYKERTVDFHRERSAMTKGNSVPGVLVGIVGWVITGFDDLDLANAGYKAGYALGSAPGAAVDEHTGAAYKLGPSKVFVTLIREAQE